MKTQSFIPFHVPSIGEDEVNEVGETLRSGWLTSGARAARFEEDFRQGVGARHALAVNSGTAALHLPLAALSIGRGDEVITTPLTFCATVNVILHLGATPVLADVDDDGNISPESIRSRVGPNTRAIVPVHLGGLPCRMSEIYRIADEHDLAVVEDGAHATGTRYDGHPMGFDSPRGSSEAVAYSFYATKNITTGEGGMVTTNDGDLAARMRILTLHGINKDAWKRYAEGGKWFYQVLEAGFKYNLTDIQAAIGIHQLRRLEGFIAARSALARQYNAEFADVAEVEVPPTCAAPARNSWHLYALRLRLDRLRIARGEFIEQLTRKGIGVSVHFIPIPLHPFFARWASLPRNACPRALALYERLISLPLYPSLRPEQVKYIARTVKEIAGKSRRSLTLQVGGPAR